MKLGVMSPVLGGMSLRQMIEYLSSLGVQSLELGCGGYPGKAHCDAADFLAHPEKIEELKQMLAENHMDLPALACHGNPLHPDKAIAGRFESDFDNAVLLAEKLGVKTLVAFSGCPGDCPESKYPNWVTCTWPNDYKKILEWQWNEVLIPYWKEKAAFCNAHGVERIAFEMHPGFMVYNPKSLMKLREAVGPTVGANFDPSHLFWQGVDVCAAIRYLKGAIYHFHAKDTRIDPLSCGVTGVLDTSGYGDLLGRSWEFRTVGYGHGKSLWNDMISTLKATGYEGVISIEHEDPLMSPKEGLEKAVAFLKDVIIFEDPDAMWWT
ncbi:MAG: sugar phosphate isomerase/epimerase family protein [Eubacteriales bacterium]|nr:sugar phosphate isomerase/epimerase [Clostridiales bacterium]